ncbi:hypothetical protein [Parvularcula oceani]|uniref:hypothetical protein n=1 Tax=Parvularcula oceani TaxID=1247963 RepID=UPI00068A1C6F|nr:hypothetical protein [Parvularcula oceani]
MRSRLLVLALTALSACAEGERDETAQYTAALNAYYADNPECVRVGRPVDDDGVVFKVMEAEASQNRETAKLDALVSAGLLTVRTVDIETPDFRTGNTVPEAERRYVLTEMGRAALAPQALAGRGRRGASQFCYGHREVTAVLRSTEPADAVGAKVTSVTYSYELSYVADWASRDAVRAAFPGIWVAADGPAEDTDELVLTNEGWVRHGAKL